MAGAVYEIADAILKARDKGCEDWEKAPDKPDKKPSPFAPFAPPFRYAGQTGQIMDGNGLVVFPIPFTVEGRIGRSVADAMNHWELWNKERACGTVVSEIYSPDADAMNKESK